MAPHLYDANMVESDAHSAEAAVRGFALQLRLARSAEMALAGRLLEAEELLMPNGSLPQTAAELDLLAKILVKQKRYAEAQKRWNEALNISSGEKCYQDALDSLSFHITALQQRKSFLLLFASVLSLTLTIALAFYAYMHLLK